MHPSIFSFLSNFLFQLSDVASLEIAQPDLASIGDKFVKDYEILENWWKLPQKFEMCGKVAKISPNFLSFSKFWNLFRQMTGKLL